MEIPVIKNSLASALTALGKLVSRTSLIKAYQGIEIEGHGNFLFFRTRNTEEEIELRLFADLKEDFSATLVTFEQFRLAVRNSKNKSLKLKIDNGEVFIDGVKLAPVEGSFPAREQIPDQDICITELPADTLSTLSLLAPITDKETGYQKKAIHGINISGDGFTATNGKELSNVFVPLGTTGSVTIPFPLTLLATKAFGAAGQLATWQKDEDTYLELTLGTWTWRTKAIKEHYPNWKRVVPERTEATHYVSFLPDSIDQFQHYLKSIPDDKDRNNAVKLKRLPGGPNHLHLESSNGLQICIRAEFDPAWDNLNFIIRKEFLLHLLNAGHTRIELNDAYGPIIGTGGTGQYIAMPIRPMKTQAQVEQKPEAQTEQIVPQPAQESASVPEQIPPRKQENPAKPNTQSTKENTTMNESPTITHAVSAPAQTFTMNQEPAKELNPLDELLANIEDMKTKIKVMFDDSAALARKVREVAISQRQKEREYQQAKRAIERIRVASGAA